MADLTTKYLGLTLKNPIIIGSCSLTSKIEDILQLYSFGTAAIVLNSVFEEEIMLEMGNTYKNKDEGNSKFLQMTETLKYIRYHTKGNRLSNYLGLIRESKSKTEIPIIASINCVTDSGWIGFTRELEKAGADALELNMFMNPMDDKLEDAEQMMMKIIKKALKAVTIPISIKLGDCYTNLSQTIRKLSASGIGGLVLFNRHFVPDIDLYNLRMVPGKMHSCENDYSKSLRWMLFMSKSAGCSLAACTGIHDANTVLKQIMAGADAVQIVSALYLNGKSYIQQMLKEIESWLHEKGKFSIQQIKGEASYSRNADPSVFERINFMKYYGRID
jgi:dihydroorotate dehydrogenase (fumarate)